MFKESDSEPKLCSCAPSRVPGFIKRIMDCLMVKLGFGSSKNRPRGTLELKPVNVDRPVYRNMLVDNVRPAIKAKWPNRRSHVYIQQDGAPAHVKETDLKGTSTGGTLISTLSHPTHKISMYWIWDCSVPYRVLHGTKI